MKSSKVRPGLSKNTKSDLQSGISLMWRANGNPNPYSDLDEILFLHPRLFKQGFGAG